MKVKLSLYASLRSYLPSEADGSHCFLQVEKGSSIADLLCQLNVPLDLPKLVFLNGIHAEQSAVLNEGDEVGAFPPVAGG